MAPTKSKQQKSNRPPKATSTPASGPPNTASPGGDSAAETIGRHPRAAKEVALRQSVWMVDAKGERRKSFNYDVRNHAEAKRGQEPERRVTLQEDKVDGEDDVDEEDNGTLPPRRHSATSMSRRHQITFDDSDKDMSMELDVEENAMDIDATEAKESGREKSKRRTPRRRDPLEDADDSMSVDEESDGDGDELEASPSEDEGREDDTRNIALEDKEARALTKLRRDPRKLSKALREERPRWRHTRNQERAASATPPPTSPALSSLTPSPNTSPVQRTPKKSKTIRASVDSDLDESPRTVSSDVSNSRRLPQQAKSQPRHSVSRAQSHTQDRRHARDKDEIEGRPAKCPRVTRSATDSPQRPRPRHGEHKSKDPRNQGWPERAWLVWPSGSGKVSLRAQSHSLQSLLGRIIDKVKYSTCFINAYPEFNPRVRSVEKIALEVAAKHDSVVYKRMVKDKKFLKAIIFVPDARLWLIRGDVKKLATSQVPVQYGLAPGCEKRVKEYLKTLKYAYAPADELPSPSEVVAVDELHPYGHKIFPDMVRDLFIKTNMFDETCYVSTDKEHPDEREVPPCMVALIATGVHCGLSEWQSGSSHRGVVNFSANVHHKVFDQHLKSLEHIKASNPVGYHSLMSGIYNDACGLQEEDLSDPDEPPLVGMAFAKQASALREPK
ncbi:hypothetical protein OF83DRAFT_1126311 [Amylostereum chailletii]|nr:hypothetical protein OF83DRAFT_1126311 [Amylostereum chailletii]